jgi:hypothetical protein
MLPRGGSHGHGHRRQRGRHQSDGGGAAWPRERCLRRCRLYRDGPAAEHADREVSWNIAIKRIIIKALPERLRDLAEAVERALSQVRAWVEHPFHIVKNLFHHKKLRYRGLAKNTAQLHTLFALAIWRSSRKPCSSRRGPDDARRLSWSRKRHRKTQPQPRFLPTEIVTKRGALRNQAWAAKPSPTPALLSVSLGRWLPLDPVVERDDRAGQAGPLEAG